MTSTILAEIIGMVQITEKPLYTIPSMLVKVILTVMKQLKQLQRKPRKKSEASTGFEPVTSTIPVQCSTITELKALLVVGQD